MSNRIRSGSHAKAQRSQSQLCILELWALRSRHLRILQLLQWKQSQQLMKRHGHWLKSTCFHWLGKLQAAVTSPVFKLCFHPIRFICTFFHIPDSFWTQHVITLHAHLFWRMGGHFRLTYKVFLFVFLPCFLMNWQTAYLPDISH